MKTKLFKSMFCCLLIVILGATSCLVPVLSVNAAATGVPGNPNLTHDNWDGDGNYTINMNMWWGNNGITWKLYENGAVIWSDSLVDNSPNQQTTSKQFSGKPNGSYTYRCELANSFGFTSSNTITVNVTNGGATPTNTPTSTYTVIPTSTTIPTSTPTSTTQAFVIFTDGFESNSFSSGGWTNSGCTISSSYKKTGSYSAGFNATDILTKTVDTGRYTNIELSYDVYTRNCESTSEKFMVDWSSDNGSTWTSLDTVSGNNGGWKSKKWPLPSSASLNPNLKIRFKVSGYDSSDNAYLDNVKITGAEKASIELSGIPFYSTMKLTWNKINDSSIAGYAIYRRTETEQYPSEPTWKSAVNSIENYQVYNDFGLTPATMYYYKIVAYNASGTLLNTIYSNEISAALSSSNANMSRTSAIKVLIAVYTPGISDVTKYINSIKEGLVFDYRNSLGRLYIDPTFMIINDPCQFDGDVGKIETDLRARGVVDDQYDGVFITASNLGYRWGGGRFLGDTYWGLGFAADYDEGPASPYMKEHREGTLSSGEVHIFIHEFGHALDALSDNCTPDYHMLNIHPGDNFFSPECEALKYGFVDGDYYDGYAAAFRTYDKYSRYPAPHNDYIEYIDADHDFMADHDPRLPVNEQVFKTSTTNADTDSDGLNDMAEYTAGIFKGTDPLSKDTDSDGTPDNIDKTPFTDWSESIDKFASAPELNGNVDASWTKIASKPAFNSDPNLSAEFYGGWDDQNLYFTVKSTEKIRLWMSVDGSGENGLWATDGIFTDYMPWEDCFKFDDKKSTAYGDYYGKANALNIDPDSNTITHRKYNGDSGFTSIPGSVIKYYAPIQGSNIHTMVFVIPKDLGHGSSISYWSYDPDYPQFYPEKIDGLRLLDGRTLGIQFTYAAVNTCKGIGSEFGTTEWDGKFASMAEVFDDYKLKLKNSKVSSLAQPCNFKLAAAGKAAKMAWDPVVNSGGYDVEIESNGNTKTYNSSSPVFDFYSLVPGTEYKVRVRAKSYAVNGSWSNQVTFTPVAVTSSAITWSLIYPDGASAKFSNMGCPDGTYLDIDNTGTNGNYTVNNLTYGTKYWGNLNYFDSADNCWHGISLQVPTFTYRAPQNTKLIAAGNKMILSWDAVDAGEYEIKIDGNDVSNIYTSSTTSFNFNELVPGIPYTVAVRAVDSTAKGYWSSPLSFTTTAVTGNSITWNLRFPDGVNVGAKFSNMHCPDGTWADIGQGGENGDFTTGNLQLHGTYSCSMNWLYNGGTWNSIGLDVTLP